MMVFDVSRSPSPKTKLFSIGPWFFFMTIDQPRGDLMMVFYFSRTGNHLLFLAATLIWLVPRPAPEILDGCLRYF